MANTRQRQLQAKVEVARKMFFGGCAFLPFLWLINLIYFRRELLSPRTPPELKKWLMRSLAGFIVMTLAFTTWVVVFQTGWESWGQDGEDLLVVKPSRIWW